MYLLSTKLHHNIILALKLALAWVSSLQSWAIFAVVFLDNFKVFMTTPYNIMMVSMLLRLQLFELNVICLFSHTQIFSSLPTSLTNLLLTVLMIAGGIERILTQLFVDNFQFIVSMLWWLLSCINNLFIESHIEGCKLLIVIDLAWIPFLYKPTTSICAAFLITVESNHFMIVVKRAKFLSSWITTLLREKVS